MSTSSMQNEIGRRLLPTILDRCSEDSPDRIFSAFIVSNKIWHDITYLELASAVNFVAWYLDNSLGPYGDFEMLAYIGASDIRYTIVFLAAMKCRYTVLALSHRNSESDHIAILQNTGCNVVLHTEETKKMIENLGNNVRTLNFPSLEEIFHSPNNDKPYPYPYKFTEMASKPVMAYQTSGSTGVPKIITLTYGWFATVDNWQRILIPEGDRRRDILLLKPGERYLNVFPNFHATGMTYNMCTSLFFGLVPCNLAPNMIATEKNVLDALQEGNMSAALLPPSTIEGLAAHPHGVKQLSKLSHIFFGGGPISYRVGNRLSSITKLAELYGGTEISLVPSLMADVWNYFKWNPNFGISMEKLDDGDNLHEMVFHKDPQYEGFHAVFQIFPELNTWRTRDLFQPVPSLPDHWIYKGRTEDTIVLSNAEKFNPTALEHAVQAHPQVKTALCFGQGREQIGMLIEPEELVWDAPGGPSKLIGGVWPLVQRHNKESSGMGRLFKNMIMVVKKDKPFHTTAKGTLSRRALLSDYALEIDALYLNSDAVQAFDLPANLDHAALMDLVRKCIEATSDGPQISDHEDFFSYGLDSLQTLGIARLLQRTLVHRLGVTNGVQPSQEITTSLLYQNPNVHALACMLGEMLGLKSVSGHSAPLGEATIEDIIQKYSAGLPSTSPLKRVILTGSTGSLGAYILYELLRCGATEKVFVLNRKDDAITRTQASFDRNHFNFSLEDDGRVEFITVNYGEQRLGLLDSDYEELSRADHAILNAWPVNFVHSLQSFEPQIRSVREFIDMSLHGDRRMHLFFISSIAAVAGLMHDADYGPEGVEELPIRIGNPTIKQGYSESKFVAERLLLQAYDQCGIPCTIARVGQVAGSTSPHGRWNDTEWLPVIIKTSRFIRKVPESLAALDQESVDWIPVDKVASIIIELMQTQTSPHVGTSPNVFHVLNPRKARWLSLVPSVQDHYYERGISIGRVSYDEWIDIVKEVGKTVTDIKIVEQVPAVKLLAFLESRKQQTLPTRELLTTRAQKASRTLASLPSINAGLMLNWLEQWDY